MKDDHDAALETRTTEKDISVTSGSKLDSSDIYLDGEYFVRLFVALVHARFVYANAMRYSNVQEGFHATYESRQYKRVREST